MGIHTIFYLLFHWRLKNNNLEDVRKYNHFTKERLKY